MIFTDHIQEHFKNDTLAWKDMVTWHTGLPHKPDAKGSHRPM